MSDHSLSAVLDQVKQEITSEQDREEVGNFFFNGLRISTWYAAVLDQSRLPPDKFARQFQIVGDRMNRQIETPSQDAFKLAAEVTQQFAAGKVDPEQLNRLAAEGKKISAITEPLIEAIRSGAGDYDIQEDLIGAPKPITDSRYIHFLAEVISGCISPDGTVVLPPATRKFLSLLVNNEASQLQRINSPIPS